MSILKLSWKITPSNFTDATCSTSSIIRYSTRFLHSYFRRVRNFDIVYTAALWLSPAFSLRYRHKHFFSSRRFRLSPFSPYPNTNSQTYEERTASLSYRIGVEKRRLLVFQNPKITSNSIWLREVCIFSMMLLQNKLITNYLAMFTEKSKNS